MDRRAYVAASCLMLLGACNSAGVEADELNRAPTTTSLANTALANTSPANAAPASTAQASTTTASPTPTTMSPPPTSTEPPAQVATTTPPSPNFTAIISEIGPDIAAQMTTSWRDGCPVALEDLRHLRLSHWDNQARVVEGELIVAASEAENIAGVFSVLFRERFVIERMELVDVYGGDDDLSMAANNTSAFNCREVAWSPGVWSRHAYGMAIDINPLVNPYVSSTRLLPPEGAKYVDRSLEVPGLITADDVVVRAFTEAGWSWGGYWTSAKDYQHFSSDAR